MSKFLSSVSSRQNIQHNEEIATITSAVEQLTPVYNLIKLDYYQQDPVAWHTDMLGENSDCVDYSKEFLWSKQREIFHSVANNRRTAVKSCHRIGKSYVAGRIAIWWINSHQPGEALVITSAHSATQVKVALWREMARAHSKGKFPGRMNQTEWYITMPDGHEEIVAFGRKPADNDPTAFQGSYNAAVLVLLDEACYVPKTLWDGVDTLISNEQSRIAVFGNPDDPNTEFAEVCKPGSGWNVITVSYRDTPNFTMEYCPPNVRNMLIGPTWVEEKRKRWGVNNPLYISKVLGEFPEISTDGLIQMKWIRDAQERTLTPNDNDDREIGVDVGGGGNKNVIGFRHGPVARTVLEDHNPDTMKTLSNVLDAIEKHNASIAKVDAIGIGHGAVDRAREMAEDHRLKKESPDLARRASLVKGVEVGRVAYDKEHFINLRAEGYWTIRERFQQGNIDIDPEDEDLAAQLAALKYKSSAGRIQIESKEDMRKRGMSSPDKADMLMLSFLKIKDEEESVEVDITWG